MTNKQETRWPPALHLSGYRTLITSPSENTLGLVIVFYSENGEETQRSIPIKEYEDKSSNYPQIHKDRNLINAICRYYNQSSLSDTTLKQADYFIDRIITEVVKLPIILMPDKSVSWSIEDEEHIISTKCKGKQEYIRIVEDQFTEVLQDKELIELKTGKRRLILDLDESV